MPNAGKYEIDMCNGPVLGKVIRFAIPVMLSSILQMLYNAADMAVVGQFAGSQALAAVGSNGPLINLIVSLCTGLSVGVSVSIANEYGAGNEKGVSDSLHTAILLSLICGAALTAVGLLLGRPMLRMMGTPSDVLDQSALYLMIIFIGMPANMLYNFGAAAMRAVGDTRRPMMYLVVSGLTNVALNLVFVLLLGMAAGGVALATIISQALSAALVVFQLLRSNQGLALRLNKLKIQKKALLEIIRIGLPAGLEGCLFSISNVLIQSAVNSFGSMAMAGNAAASNIDSLVNITCYSVSTAAMTFTGQNMGAKKYRRLIRLALTCSAVVFIIATLMSQLGMLFSEQLLSLYTHEAEAIAFGKLRLKYLFTIYFTCTFMDLFSCILMGMGHSMMSMLVCVGGVCGFRILWLLTAFAKYGTPQALYLSYPLSWSITAVLLIGCYIYQQRKLLRSQNT